MKERGAASELAFPRRRTRAVPQAFGSFRFLMLILFAACESPSDPPVTGPATEAQLNVVVTDSTAGNEIGIGTIWQRIRGTAPGMANLVYWDWSYNWPNSSVQSIPLGTNPERTFSHVTIASGQFLTFEATDSNGVRQADTIRNARVTAQLMFPPSHVFFVDDPRASTELDFKIRAFESWSTSGYLPPAPDIERLDLIHPHGTHSLQITPASEVAFKWSPRLTEEITHLKVRAYLEGGHVSVTSFPVIRVPPPEEPGVFASVAAMSGYTCGVAVDAQIQCWGDPKWHDSRLFEKRLVPGEVPVLNELGIAQVTGGWGHSCGIDDIGIAYCWGQNGTGALGDGTTEPRMGPVRVSGDLRFLSINTAFGQTCGIADDRRAYCWGSTANPDIQQFNTAPVEIPGGITFSSIVVQGEFCGVSTAGEMYCWWQWTDPAPRRISASAQMVQVTGTDEGICALDAAGDVWCLQSGTLSKVISGFGFGSISGQCGLTADSRAYCWGTGWLGSGEGRMSSTAPLEVAGGLRFRSLSTRDTHSCGVTLENAIYCWGSGYSGQLGNGSLFSVSVPIRVRDPAT